jgi:hypothetical protein
LCAFNNLCREKYNRLGLTWDFAQAPLMPRADLEALAETARASGVNPGIVQTGGATRLEALDRSGSSGPGDSPDRPRPDLRLIQGGRSTSQLDDSTAEPKPQPREVTP